MTTGFFFSNPTWIVSLSIFPWLSSVFSVASALLFAVAFWLVATKGPGSAKTTSGKLWLTKWRSSVMNWLRRARNAVKESQRSARESRGAHALTRLRQIGPMLGVAIILLAWLWRSQQLEHDRAIYRQEFKAWKARSAEYQRVMESWLEDHPSYRRNRSYERTGY